MTEESALFDPVHWRPSEVFRRCRGWIGATRRRRWTTWTLIALVVLFICPGIMAVLATAQTGTGTVSAPNSALSWMRIKDSSGVELSSYLFATNRGGVLNPGNLVLSFLIIVLFAIWLVITVTAIWLPTDTLDFGWLTFVSKPLQAVAESLSGQIATPIMLVTFVAIGGIPVGVFIVRGYFSKASMQVVMMVGVAILGPLFLAEPLAEVLAPDGLLAQGRNLGISVAAGLNGNSNPNPNQLIQTMQADMADNFARSPLQVWNFGHVVDDRASCRAAWSAGVTAGDEDRVKNGMKSCGDTVAYSAADNPSVGQIGAGILLLFSGTVLLLFGAYLAIKVIWAALDSIYYGFMTIFGFAAGGFVYGPTQTFTIRCVVHGFVSAGRMAVFVIFLGVYELFLGDLFKQARGQVMSVFVIVAIVEIVAIFQLKRLNAGLEKGNDWIANRFALAIQNGGARVGSGGGGGSGTALGMGQFGASHKMSGIGMMALMGGVSTIANSPLTEWMMGGLPGSIHPQSRLKRAITEAQGGVWAEDGRFGGRFGWYSQSYMNRELFAANAGAEAGVYGGLDSFLGNAAAVQGVIDVGGTAADSYGAMLGAGARNEERARLAVRSRATIGQAAANEPLQDRDLAFLAASLRHTQNSARLLINGDGTAEEVAANMGTLQQAAREFRRVRAGGVTLDDGTPYVPGTPQLNFVQEYMNDIRNNPDVAIEKMQALNDVINRVPVPAPTLANPTAAPSIARARLQGANVDVREAERMKQWIMNEHAKDAQEATERLIGNVADPDAIRDLRDVVFDAVRTEHLGSGRTGDLSNTVTPRGRNNADPRWVQIMPGVNRLLGN
ncbi:hypothetical protein ACQP1G_12425 [Nocardia sp. CA-107356]|uniref:hypothetical protein n=1 Tax=Nocardia sp. CA-107356 TaxID=3239972 RepID=UPI003D8EB1EA